MKKTTFAKWTLFFLFINFIISCSRENEPLVLTSNTQDNFVGLSLAKEIAGTVYFENKTSYISKKNSPIKQITKTIKTIDEIKNINKTTSFYIINYNEGGFLLLSADKRINPILGFSEEGKFIIDEKSYPLGLKFWMEDTKKQITDIQNSNIEQSKRDKLIWEKIQLPSVSVNQSTTARPPVEACYEHTEINTVGPLLNTTWEQGWGFNDALPFISCNGNNFQVYAGCVPIAMAQVMKYHNYPNNYNWSAMPLNYGTPTTANLILDIHNSIRSFLPQNPSYSCDGTGVSSSANMGAILKLAFKYSSADWANYNYQVVKDNLSAGRPVILSGSNNSSGHMWVCDGYLATTYYFNDCTGIGYLHFRMNWGWGGSNDGYYAFDNFNPGNTTYNNNKKMIYNIKP